MDENGSARQYTNIQGVTKVRLKHSMCTVNFNKNPSVSNQI